MKRVLIGEDSPDLVMGLRYFLEGAPFSYDVATTGQEVTALHHLAQVGGKPYDLFVLDIAMPMKLGTTALREIREGGDTKTPAMIMTGLPPNQAMKEIKGLGVFCVLYKPRAYEEIVRRISLALEGVCDDK
jgi:DNA-binding response OmpR family regulator